MDYQNAITEAQARADNTGMPVCVASDGSAPGGYRASLMGDLRLTEHKVITICNPSGRFYGRYYHSPNGRIVRYGR